MLSFDALQKLKKKEFFIAPVCTEIFGDFSRPQVKQNNNNNKKPKITYFQVLKNAFFTTKILHLLAQSTTETFQLTIHCLTWTLFMISFDYIPIYIYLYIQTYICTCIYILKSKAKMLEKKPLSMVKLSRSQFAYRNQTKKQQTTKKQITTKILL